MAAPGACLSKAALIRASTSPIVAAGLPLGESETSTSGPVESWIMKSRLPATSIPTPPVSRSFRSLSGVVGRSWKLPPGSVVRSMPIENRRPAADCTFTRLADSIAASLPMPASNRTVRSSASRAACRSKWRSSSQTPSVLVLYSNFAAAVPEAPPPPSSGSSLTSRSWIVSGGSSSFCGARTCVTFLSQISSSLAASRADMPSTSGIRSSRRPLWRMPPRKLPTRWKMSVTPAVSSWSSRPIRQRPGRITAAGLSSLRSSSVTRIWPESFAPRIDAETSAVSDPEASPLSSSRTSSGLPSSMPSDALRLPVAEALIERAVLSTASLRKRALSAISPATAFPETLIERPGTSVVSIVSTKKADRRSA